MLSLESERLTGTLSRCYSILSDWGVESAIWRVPAELLKELKREANYDTLFGLALFIPDGDHALHHVSRLVEQLSKFPCFGQVTSCYKLQKQLNSDVGNVVL